MLVLPVHGTHALEGQIFMWLEQFFLVANKRHCLFTHNIYSVISEDFMHWAEDLVTKAWTWLMKKTIKPKSDSTKSLGQCNSNPIPNFQVSFTLTNPSNEIQDTFKIWFTFIRVESWSINAKINCGTCVERLV